ncbi:flagellar hook-length control protein FliK [bacterium]|nr:flagellar hook-length control protein FliK [bacterium]
MRIEAFLPATGLRPAGGADEGLYARLLRTGPTAGRVLGPADSATMLVRVWGTQFELNAPQPLAAGTLLRLSAHPSREGIVVAETLAPADAPRQQVVALQTPPAGAQVDVGGLDALLARLGQPGGPAHRTLAAALLALGLPVHGQTLAALAAVLPNLTPQQGPALQLLLALALPVSESILAQVQEWMSSAGATLHLSEFLAAARGRERQTLADWILRLSDTLAPGTVEKLFSPFLAPSREHPAPDDLPRLLARLLAQGEPSPRGQMLLSQLHLAETLSAHAGSGGLLLFPLFLDCDGEPAVAWARLEREAAQDGEETTGTRITLALALSRLGPLQIDLLLSGPRLSIWFFFANESVVETARGRLPALRQSLAAQGFSVGDLDAVRAATVAVNLLGESLEQLLAGGAGETGREWRA